MHLDLEKYQVYLFGSNRVVCILCSAIYQVYCHLILYHTIPTFNDLEKEAFENIAGKGENAGNQHFLLFPQCFLPFPKQSSIFQSNLICRLQML